MLKNRCGLPLLLTAILLLAGACAPRPALQEKPAAPSLQEWRFLLGARSSHWERYQAAWRLRGQTNQGNFAFRSLAFADLPHRFRLEAFNPLGHGVALLTVDTRLTRLWMPAERIVYTSSQPEPLLGRMLGISFPFESLPYLMAASVPENHIDSLSFEADPDGWLAVRHVPAEGVRYTYQFISQPLSLSGVKVKQGLWDYEVRYEPPVEVNRDAIPQRLTLSGIDWTLTVVVEQMDRADILPQEIFRPQVPEGVQVMGFVGHSP